MHELALKPGADHQRSNVSLEREFFSKYPTASFASKALIWGEAIALAIGTYSAISGTLGLTWDSRTDVIANHKLYMEKDGSRYKTFILPANKYTVQLLNVPNGSYNLFMTAIDTNGEESLPSNTVQWVSDSGPRPIRRSGIEPETVLDADKDGAAYGEPKVLGLSVNNLGYGAASVSVFGSPGQAYRLKTSTNLVDWSVACEGILTGPVKTWDTKFFDGFPKDEQMVEGPGAVYREQSARFFYAEPVEVWPIKR
jgi:hypothetical protein